MQIRQIEQFKWRAEFDCNRQFGAFAFYQIFEGESMDFTYDMACNLSANIRNEPLSEFRFNPYLRDLFIKDCDQLKAWLSSFKGKRFICRISNFGLEFALLNI